MNKSEPDDRTTRERRAVNSAPFSSPRPSIEDRMAAGKALRVRRPRGGHAVYRPSPTRQDPVSILEEQSKARLPDLVPIRYARMLASPFAFLRGAAAVMAADLARGPVTGLTVQACGDTHVANFGVFGSAERQLIFGMNDFDETMTGPWEWDLKRLTASAVVCARYLGGDKALCEAAARATVRSYRKRMNEYAWMGHVAVWYCTIGAKDVLRSLPPGMRTAAERIEARARSRGVLQVVEKMAELVDDQVRIIEHEPLIVREKRTQDGRPVREVAGELLAAYVSSLSDERKQLIARYRVADIARKVVGVGSVGTRCWVVLLTGNDLDDPLILQYKQAVASVLAPYVKAPTWDCEGKRVVVGQRLIQGAPDIFLGWGSDRIAGDFYMRQLRDMKGGAVFQPGVTDLRGLPDYCKLCGWALAQAHAKSGDPAGIAGYLGQSDAMDDAIARYALAYSDQNDRDFDALGRAAKSKRIPVAKAE